MRHPNLPITLLFTLRTIFDQLHGFLPGYTALPRDTGELAWEDWIFAESKLRTATVNFLLAACYDVNFGLPCDRDIDHAFGELELPATKTLWEAKDEKSWRRAFHDLHDMAGPSEPRLRYEELVELNKSQANIDRRDVMKTESNLEYRVEAWRKEMDELGMLVTLCSIIDH